MLDIILTNCYYFRKLRLNNIPAYLNLRHQRPPFYPYISYTPCDLITTAQSTFYSAVLFCSCRFEVSLIRNKTKGMIQANYGQKHN